MLKSNIKLEKFKKALIALESIYLQPMRQDRSNIDATIQRFEFTFELAWKFLKDYFAERDLELHYPKEILQQAYQVKLIDNENIWIKMLQDRNLTSHAYNANLADMIFERIALYVPELRALADKISS